MKRESEDLFMLSWEKLEYLRVFTENNSLKRRLLILSKTLWFKSTAHFDREQAD